MLHIPAFDCYIGRGIDGIALVHQLLHDSFRILGLKQGTIGAFHHAFHEQRQIGLEPDRNAMGMNALAGFFVDKGATSGRQDLRAVFNQARDYAALAFAKIGLTMIVKNFGDGLVGGNLDFMVGIDKGNFQLFSEPAANA